MPLDLSEVAASPDVDANDVVMTVSEPSERYWKRHQRHPSGSGSHPIVVVPSDSEDDSDDDDIAIVSVCPPPPSDNDDCIVESYQPPTETFCAVNPDRMLAVRSASDDGPAVDVSCTDSGLDLQFYSRNTDQSGAFLVHNMQNLGAWILSSQPSSSVKQPDVNSVQNTCSGDSAVLPCSSDFGLPLSIPSANGAHPQPPFSSESMQFNTVQLQTGGILFDMGAAKVSANIDKTSVLSLSAKIQSSDDRHSTTLSFVGSISDRKSPTGSDFVSVQTGIKRPPDDLNLSLVAVSPVASPDVASNDKVDSCCQTASVSLDVNTLVDAALNDTVDGLLKQMSSRKEKPSKPDVLHNGEDVKQAHQTVNTDVVDNKIKDAAYQRRFLSLLNPHPAGISHAFSHVPTSSGSFTLSKKRKSHHPWTSSASGSKSPRLPLPTADSATPASEVFASPLVECCCSCNGPTSVEKLSHCLAGHPCCGTCLEKYVKALLTSTVKVDMVCRKPDCDAVYLATELRNSLPDIVVEILQEKLNQKNSEDPASCVQATISQPRAGSTDYAAVSRSGSGNTTGVRHDDELNEFPVNWEPMDSSERYRKVELEPGSSEYDYVSSAFHKTMSWSRARILHIHRVQNHTLWQFYVVKRRQMQRDNGSELVNERFLFHGTSRNTVDAICANNFDWRLCGSHGTVYGQGSYFATEASYSHMYTDAAGSSRSRLHHSSLFGLGMRAIPISYRRVNFPGLYPVGTAPPAHQPKAVVSPQVNVQPAHQPLSGLLSAHMPVPDVSTFIPPIFRIPSVTYSGSQPSLGASGSIWGQTGSCSRCPAVAAGNPPQVVDPNVPPPNPVLPGRPTSFSGSCAHKSYFLSPPMAHRVLPSLAGAGSRSAAIPTTPTPPYGSSSQSHHIMFFARVLVGRSAVGRSDYRTPPPLDPSDQFGRCFDSCINRPVEPSIYVIFNNAQCYPSYIVEYVNKLKSSDPV